MQRLVRARRRLQLGPGGAEVTCGQREPAPDLSQQRPARGPGEIRGERGDVGQRRDVGQPGPLDQRIGAVPQRRRDRERHAVLHRDLDDRAHLGFGGH